jgi:hypothetical protein
VNTTRRLLTAFRSSGKFRPRTVKELKKRLDDIGDAVAMDRDPFMAYLAEPRKFGGEE